MAKTVRDLGIAPPAECDDLVNFGGCVSKRDLKIALT
jgi:hypothetical protein